jgi:hypothetical protein
MSHRTTAWISSVSLVELVDGRPYKVEGDVYRTGLPKAAHLGKSGSIALNALPAYRVVELIINEAGAEL